MKTAQEVRQEFLDYFRERGHTIVPSSPVFPKDDPTLYFTNAGMNQFKDVFLGAGTRPYKRAADTQKCIRVSGKHNDLEEVGRDTYHHTFFEMLGNWSFGDYFKRDAIAWSWELLTKVWGIPKNRLWVTVFGGDEKDGLPADDEAERIWHETTDIPKDRVLRFGRKDNFWEMGDTGPCGPCTEIHIDRGGPDSNPEDGKDRKIGVNAGNERFMELWNNVFIQFNRREDGSLRELPAKHVDTGMGFERVLAYLQGKRSNYDSDLFTPIFQKMAEITGLKYQATGVDRDVAFRVVADHVRALTSAISDGATPGNDGRGYVLRRLLRRAARFGRQHLGMDRPFIHKLVPVVADVLGGSFPEMRAQKDHVALILESEEKSFLVTLDKGITLFESVASKLERTGAKTVPGDQAYDLYATYGFPRDLVDLMARERGLAVDDALWKSAEALHKSASKGEGTGKYVVSPEQIEGQPATVSLCYAGEGGDGTTADARILKLIDGKVLVLDRTPFYAESGGQVGDAGTVTAPGFCFRVDDTKKLGDVILHLGAVVQGSAEKPPTAVRCEVDSGRRLDVMANHTGTHLLHWALKQVLGPHCNQQGSLVAADRLRFDLTHSKAITLDEIERIEELVNTRIAGATNLKTSVEELEAAKRRGVTALFGEKYDQRVRVVDIGGYSTELCGGTHCASTGQIGAFTILSESAVSAGVRRIEAITRGAAIRRMQEQRRTLREVANSLKAAESEIVTRIQGLQEQNKELKKGGQKSAQADVHALAKSLLAEATDTGTALVVSRVLSDFASKDLSPLCDAFKNSPKPVAGVLGLVEDQKAVVVVFASAALAPKRVHSGNIVKEIAPLIGGGGGGRPDFAQAGGKDADALPAAIQRGTTLLTTALKA